MAEDTKSPNSPSPAALEQERSERLVALLQARYQNLIQNISIQLRDVVIILNRQDLLPFVQRIKLDPQLAFSLLVDITAVDWMDARSERFEVVYHLLSLEHLYRLRIKIAVPESDASIDSLVALWPGANYMERETWDMYGVVFKGNSDLRRLLMYDEFKGHPLRKDYPIQKKQPRVRLIAPEVRNTALDMIRPDLGGQLVQIGRRVDGGQARMVSRGIDQKEVE